MIKERLHRKMKCSPSVFEYTEVLTVMNIKISDIQEFFIFGEYSHSHMFNCRISLANSLLYDILNNEEKGP